LLFISGLMPYPPTGGEKIRVWNLLRSLSEFCEIYLIILGNKRDAEVFLQEQVHSQIMSVCKEACLCNMTNLSEEPLLKKLVFQWPLLDSIARFWLLHSQVIKKVNFILEKHQINLIWVDYGYNAHYWKINKMCHVKTIFDAHNAQSELDRQLFQLTALPMRRVMRYIRWKNAVLHERIFLPKYDQVIVVSKEDAEFYGAFINKEKLFVIPNYIDLSLYKPTDVKRKENALCFIGNMGAFQNQRAVYFFLNEIWPLIKTKLPDVKFYIVGKNPPQDLWKKKLEGVYLTRFVDSPIDYLRKCKVFVAPLLDGSGTRFKILEAMACNVPVVSTSKGCEGLQVENGKNILIADSPEDFAHAVLKLLESPELRAQVGHSGRQVVEKFYSAKVNTLKLKDLVRKLVEV